MTGLTKNQERRLVAGYFRALFASSGFTLIAVHFLEDNTDYAGAGALLLGASTALWFFQMGNRAVERES